MKRRRKRSRRALPIKTAIFFNKNIKMIPSKTRSQFVSAPPVPTNLPRSFVVVGMGSAYFSSGIEKLSTGSLSYCTGVAMRIERNQGDCDRVLAHFGNLLPDTHIECATDNQRVFQSSTLKYFLKYLADEISSAREQSLKCTLVITFGYANRTAGTLRQACQTIFIIATLSIMWLSYLLRIFER